MYPLIWQSAQSNNNNSRLRVKPKITVRMLAMTTKEKSHQGETLELAPHRQMKYLFKDSLSILLAGWPVLSGRPRRLEFS